VRRYDIHAGIFTKNYIVLNRKGLQNIKKESRMKKSVVGCGILAAVMGVATTGCMMTGSYHSAKTLEPGTSSFGLTFGVNEIKTNESQPFALPTLLPELTFHTGIMENLEVGGRIAPSALGIEGDVKYRFLKTSSLHLAVDPAVGYQGLLIMKGITVSLPIISTVDLAKNFAVTTALFGRYGNYSAPDTSVSKAFQDIIGNFGMVGGAFGPEIRGETFFIRPMVEFARVFRLSGDQKSPWNRVSVAVHFGWIMGREKQQLDRIEKKIDKMDNSGGNSEQKKTDPEK
jgi:hypothetical protein